MPVVLYAEYWMTESLWQSWSSFDRHVAVDKLRFEILTTTNHLESFNGVLNTYLCRWQRGNHHLRIDVLLLHLLITNILPSVFQARAPERQEKAHLTSILRDLPGSTELVKQALKTPGYLWTAAIISLFSHVYNP